MTKHTDEFLQFAEPVTCREYTLPRDDKSTDPKGWIQGNTKIGPVLLNKLVTDLIDKEYDDNEQETSETKTEVFVIASQSKAKEKPRRPSTACSFSRTCTCSWQNMD